MAKAASKVDIQTQLEKAADDRALVRLSRSIRRSDKLEGFVVRLGVHWVLVAVLDPSIFLDGFAAVRLSQISKVTRRGGPDSFVGRALALRDQWPPATLEVNLDRTADLLRTAGESFPLVTVHLEADDPEVCFVGRCVGFTSRSVELLEISPEAEWDARPTKYALAALSRVEMGGRYEAALAAVGGEPPLERIGPRQP